ncbi:hypothetical protein QAD02_000516 [Eretmocerus hayati]|uniref:Uncharacterized protein n=1 Tax=Eretmocerus hayati TaxID=131215 RepID=A0ACC2NDM4_9HYME|nr:hypothetical protein QAD02_000516 [Eretmocerus hayati]
MASSGSDLSVPQEIGMAMQEEKQAPFVANEIEVGDQNRNEAMICNPPIQEPGNGPVPNAFPLPEPQHDLGPPPEGIQPEPSNPVNHPFFLTYPVDWASLLARAPPSEHRGLIYVKVKRPVHSNPGAFSCERLKVKITHWRPLVHVRETTTSDHRDAIIVTNRDISQGIARLLVLFIVISAGRLVTYLDSAAREHRSIDTKGILFASSAAKRDILPLFVRDVPMVTLGNAI